MVRFLRFFLIFLILLGAGVFITRPGKVDAGLYTQLEPDLQNGERVFNAGGCASCHTDPAADPADPPVLSGGYRIESPFGTFVAPNITPGPAGIGGWTTVDMANALIEGTTPNGSHYYPAFPYTTYRMMTPQDVVDLKAHLDTLPVSESVAPDHELGFPFNVRAGLALWKMVNLNRDWVVTDVADEQIARGRYLVEALGHCGECHTPRTFTGAMDRSAWLSGAPNPSGDGRIPAITPSELGWSAADIAYYLESGFTPDYDSAGGEMADVVTNLAQLPPEDRAAIAAYLIALPSP